MIGFEINGAQLKLSSQQQIRVEDQNDIMRFDISEPFVTWPFLLPAAPNQVVFNFPNDIDNPQNSFVETEGVVTLNRNTWKKGILSAEKASDDEIETEFTSKAGVLAKYKDTLIGELVTGTFEVEFTKTDTELINLDTKSMVCYPIIAVGEKLYNYPDPNNIDDRLPIFKVKLLLKNILRNLGYDYLDFLTTTGSDFDKLAITGLVVSSYLRYANPVGTQLTSDYVPQIKFGDLMGLVSGLFCAKNIVNNESLYIKSISYDRTMTLTADDLSSVLLKGSVSEKYKNTFGLSFAGDEQDGVYDHAPSGQYKGALYTEATLYSQSPDLNDYYFITTRNRYYKWVEDDSGSAYWRADRFPFEALNPEADSVVKIPAIPVEKVRRLYTDATGGAIVDNGSGKVRIEHSAGGRNVGAISVGKIIRLLGQDVYSSYTDYVVTASDPYASPEWTDIDLDFISEVDAEVEIVEIYDFYFPRVNAENVYEIESRETQTKPTKTYMMYYYGLQSNIGSTETYAYASNDCYTSGGSSLGGHALRLVHSNGLFDGYWKRFVHFAKNTRLWKGRFLLDDNELLSLDIFRPKIMNGVKFILRRVKSVVGTKAIDKTEFEAYRVP